MQTTVDGWSCAYLVDRAMKASRESAAQLALASTEEAVAIATAKRGAR